MIRTSVLRDQSIGLIKVVYRSRGRVKWGGAVLCGLVWAECRIDGDIAALTKVESRVQFYYLIGLCG
jgi:hypothetical protein